MAQNIEIQIKTAVDSANSAQTLGQLKNSLIELQNIAESSDLGKEQFQAVQQSIQQTSEKMADVTGKVGDIRDKIKTLDGSPVERLNNSFGLLGEGVRNLDFGKVVTGIKGIGAAVAANPLGLLLTSITTIITLMGGWKEVLGVVTNALNFIIKPITDFFGAFRSGGDDIEYATQRMDEFNNSLTKSQFDYDKRVIQMENELSLMRERGATAAQIAEQERKIAVEKSNFLWDLEKKTKQEIEAINVTLQANELNGRKLTEKQIEDFSKNRLKLQTDLSKIELELQKNYGAIDVLETKKNNASKIKSNKEVVDDTKKNTEDINKNQNEAFNSVKKRLDSEIENVKINQREKLNLYKQEFLEGKISYETLQAEKVLLEREANEEIINIRDSFTITDTEKIKIGLDNFKKLKDDNQKEITSLTQANLDIDINLRKEYNDFLENQEKEAADFKEQQRQEDIEREKEASKIRENINKKEELKKRAEAAETQKLAFEFASASLSSISTLTDIVFENRKRKAEAGSKAEEALARKQFQINKSLQLGIAVINGIQSILAITSVPDFTLGVQSALRIGAQVVLNAASIAKIASQTFKPNATSVTPPTPPSIPSGGAQTPTFQPTQFFGLGQTTPGQGGGQQQSTRVYVTENDISNTQNRVRVVENRARFG